MTIANEENVPHWKTKDVGVDRPNFSFTQNRNAINFLSRQKSFLKSILKSASLLTNVLLQNT